MKTTGARSKPTSPRKAAAKRVVPVGLRTGKIHAVKAGASEIRKAVGVTKADEQLALRALAAAGSKVKSGTSAVSIKKKVAVKRSSAPKQAKRTSKPS